jgi:hypothetical protein
MDNYWRVEIPEPAIVNYTFDQKHREYKISSTDPLTVNSNGIPLTSAPLRIEDNDLAPLVKQLPDDYVPIRGDVELLFQETMLRFYERAYVHTDKPYYYPGETIWFKTYLHYYYPAWRDSLSTVLHAEIISPTQKIILYKDLALSHGVAHNNFFLADTLPHGDYMLRVYTNLQRNFGDSALFVKTIPILSMLEKPEEMPVKTENEELLSLSFDKANYVVGDVITVTPRLTSGDDGPIKGSFSISVTDASQVVEVPEEKTILNSLTTNKTAIAAPLTLTHRLERELSFNGQFFNDRDKPDQTVLNFVRMQSGIFQSVQTDKEGNFEYSTDLFTDTATFYVKSIQSTDAPFGRVLMKDRIRPPVVATSAGPHLSITSASSAQRIYSEYERPADVTMLQEVEIKSSKLVTEAHVDRVEHPYGKPDYVLTPKDLNLSFGNLYMAIIGKVPGLVLRDGVLVFNRSAGQSIGNGRSILVTVDNIPLQGDVKSVLEMIDPNTVESIEFTSRLNVLYGSQGAFGVISIFTKKGAITPSAQPDTYQKVMLTGLARVEAFPTPPTRAVRSDTPVDFRSTIYWNHSVDLHSSEVTSYSFPTTDLPGRYRVTIEGMTDRQVPLRRVYYVEVGSK